MKTTQRTRAARVQRLNRTAGRRLFDRQARRHLGISGKEFIQKWDAGTFNGTADNPKVIRVAMLLPFGR